MGMLTYAKLKSRPRVLRALTGLSPEAFRELDRVIPSLIRRLHGCTRNLAIRAGTRAQKGWRWMAWMMETINRQRSRKSRVWIRG
jgi:hypothetical protein